MILYLAKCIGLICCFVRFLQTISLCVGKKNDIRVLYFCFTLEYTMQVNYDLMNICAWFLSENNHLGSCDCFQNKRPCVYLNRILIILGVISSPTSTFCTALRYRRGVNVVRFCFYCHLVWKIGDEISNQMVSFYSPCFNKLMHGTWYTKSR